MEEGQAWFGEVTCWVSDQEPLPAKATVKRVDLNNQKLFLLVLQDPVAYKTLEERLRQEKAQTREMYITLRNLMKAIEQEKKGWEGTSPTRLKNTCFRPWTGSSRNLSRRCASPTWT